MALTIYGSPRSRTMRTLWMATELGLDYEHAPHEWDSPLLRSPEFLALNPAGAIPISSKMASWWVPIRRRPQPVTDQRSCLCALSRFLSSSTPSSVNAVTLSSPRP